MSQQQAAEAAGAAGLCCHSRLDAEAAVRTQASAEPGIQEIYKRVKRCHSPHCFFWRGILLFLMKICYMC